MQEGTSILHYEITEKLGEGGMGVVYKVRDSKFNRSVALKLLPPHLTKSKKFRKRFIREAKKKSLASDNQTERQGILLCGEHGICSIKY